MRIEVIGAADSTTPQARAYTEYRLFATLARHMRVIRRVREVLAHAERNGNADRVRCVVNLVLEPTGSVCARAQGPHAYGAIDRATERIGDLMARRTTENMSS
jgi:ribosome-associated translation inhibitor RaiA